MKTIVTGGTGFIGSALVQKLLETGEDVRLLILPNREVRQVQHLDLEIAYGDVRDYESLLHAFKGGTTLYHLAAKADLWAPDPAIFAEVNYRGTLNVLQAAERVGTFEKIVYTSSAMVLRRDRENDSPGFRFLDKPEEAFGPYSLSKLLAGKVVQQAAEALPVVLVAPTIPIGPGDRRLTPPTRLLLNYLNGRIRALYDGRLNVVDVRDVAAGHIIAAKSGTVGSIYPLAGYNLTLSQFLRQVAEMTGVRVPLIKVPYFFALWFAWLNEFIANRITGKPPLATMAGVKRARKPLEFDRAQVRAELKMRLRPLDISLFDAIQDLLKRSLIRKPISLRKPKKVP